MEQAEHKLALLGAALWNVLKAAGILNDEVVPNGPELLMAAEDCLAHLQTREALAKTAEAIQKYNLSVLAKQDIRGQYFHVANHPPPGRPIRAIADARLTSTGPSLQAAVEAWVKEHAPKESD